MYQGEVVPIQVAAPVQQVVRVTHPEVAQVTHPEVVQVTLPVVVEGMEDEGNNPILHKVTCLNVPKFPFNIQTGYQNNRPLYSFLIHMITGSGWPDKLRNRLIF